VTLLAGIVTREVTYFSNQFKASKKNKSHKNKKRDDDESANAATDELDDALICSLDSPDDSWIMDSGASFHTTPSKDLLSNYIFGRFGKVYLQIENLLTLSEEVI